MGERQPRQVVEELFRRLAEDDGDGVIDELIAADMVNHAAGPDRQGSEGWRQIVAAIRHDFGDDVRIEDHRSIAEGEYVVQHMTMHGHHIASTTPLLARSEPDGKPLQWTYIHIWRVAGGKIVEHWACRDDVGLLRQVGSWPPPDAQ